MNRSPSAQPLSGRSVVVAALCVLLLVSAVVTVLLLTVAAGGDPARTAARLDALRIGLSAGLGGGGLFALYLAWRRQQSTELALLQAEQVAADNRADAAARRITDLYTKAADQLGSDKAPVRLAGLYALERVAQDHPSQRQTIVNVLCAYLRMPYPVPDISPPAGAGPAELAEHRERLQEREVRLTAQRILSEHLVRRGPGEGHWPDIDLDLTGALLIDFYLWRCSVRHAKFVSAMFVGQAVFRKAVFTGRADFWQARFCGEARFDHASFREGAHFGGSRFDDLALFSGAEFDAVCDFQYAEFGADAAFDDTVFHSPPGDVAALPLGPRTVFEGAGFANGAPESIANLGRAPLA